MSKTSTAAILAQKSYAGSHTSRQGLGLIVPEAFVRGIRNIGYRTNAEAIAEFVDNSIQACAGRVDLVFGYAENGSERKPIQLAVIDDGHGISPSMMRIAMMWGGTHRENDRSGLGRFGYGLPCATVSMGRRFTIYSKLKRGRIHAVKFDLDLLDGGAYADADASITIPAAEPTALPSFLRDALKCVHPDGWKSGTIILVEKLDRLDWTTAIGLRRNLVAHLGVIYHKLLRATSIHVDGEQVRPIDPLFLVPDTELHSIDEDRAVALDPVVLRIDGARTSARSEEVHLRYAWLPPSFAATDKSRDAIGINANARFSIIKRYHGIVFSRNGRVVDVQSRTPWTVFANNDRYIRIEVEFPATLDEAFGVTTSKQQISVSPEMWDQLRVAGLQKAIEHLRSKVQIAKGERLAKRRDTLQRTDVTASIGHILSVDRVASGKLFDQSDSELEEAIAAVQSSVAIVGPATALRSLLDEIQRRSAVGDATIKMEYARLINGWASQIGRFTAAPPSTFNHATTQR